MPHKAAAIANYFLDLAEKSGETLTQMKVQKLVYFAHGWCLALNEVSLIDEQVEAWKFGPVIRSLYHDLKSFGSDPVTGRIRRIRHDESAQASGKSLKDMLKQFHFYTPALSDDANVTRSFLDQVWTVYSPYTGVQLSNMTHDPDTPWSQVMKEYVGTPPKGTDIPSSVIRAYFNKLATE